MGDLFNRITGDTIYLCFNWKNSEENFPQLHVVTLSVIRISRLDDAFSGIAETRNLQQKDKEEIRMAKKKKGKKRKRKESKNPEKPEDLGLFLSPTVRELISRVLFN